MVWGKYCIVFTPVVVIHFYSKSWTPWVFWVFCSEESCKLTNQDITWLIKDMKFEYQWFLKYFRRQYNMIKIHFKLLGVSRQKNGRKPFLKNHLNVTLIQIVVFGKLFQKKSFTLILDQMIVNFVVQAFWLDVVLPEGG
jgi:hypothetical protein